MVRLKFVQKPDAAALVSTHVEHDPTAFFLNAIKSGIQLRSTVTTLRTKDIAGQAFGVNADEHVVTVAHLTNHHRDDLLTIDQTAVTHRAVGAKARGQNRVSNSLNKGFVTAAIRNQVSNGNQSQTMFLGKSCKLRQAGHRSVIVDNLSNDSG